LVLLRKKKPPVPPSEKVGRLGRVNGDAKRGGEGLADDGNGVGGDGRLIQPLGIEERKCRLKNDDMNVIETVLDKDGSTP